MNIIRIRIIIRVRVSKNSQNNKNELINEIKSRINRIELLKELLKYNYKKQRQYFKREIIY